MKSKQEKVENLKEILVRFALILVIINIVVASIIYIRQLNTKNVVSNEFYQYIGDVKQEYIGELELSKEGEITTLRTVNVDITLDSTPVYYKNEDRVIFPEDMEIVFLNSNSSVYKIPRFSTISQEKESIYTEINNKQFLTQNAFLYDGNNLYFFIEPTLIKIGNKEYELSPMSYVYIDYGDDIEIYNKKADEYYIEETTGMQVTATCRNNNCTIDLNVDSLNCGGKEQLLPKKIDKLQIWGRDN